MSEQSKRPERNNRRAFFAATTLVGAVALGGCGDSSCEVSDRLDRFPITMQTAEGRVDMGADGFYVEGDEYAYIVSTFEGGSRATTEIIGPSSDPNIFEGEIATGTGQTVAVSINREANTFSASCSS